MPFGMPNAIDIQRVEMEVRDLALAHHHLMVDARLRNRRPSWLANLRASFRALFAPRPVLRGERGV